MPRSDVRDCRNGSRWRAFLKPAKRVVPADVLRFGTEGKVCFLGQLDATVESKEEGGEATLAFMCRNQLLRCGDLLPTRGRPCDSV